LKLNEMVNIMKILSRSYPRDATYNDPGKISDTAEVWTALLEDLPVELVLMAVKKHCMTSRFPPTIAEIREASTTVVKPQLQIPASEAWGEVIRAVRRFGFYREEEAIATLSEQTRSVVKNIGWKDICTCDEPDVIRGQFRKAYESSAARRKEDAVLPESWRKDIEQLAGSMMLQLPGA